MTATPPTGFLNLHKPLGCTSHDCVAQVRRAWGQRWGKAKVGHGGTLDPDASGVLPMALGRATRLLDFLPGEKAYRAVIRFGVVTSTDDLAGEVVHQAAVPGLTEAAAIAPLPQFLGRQTQIPPQYSAIQVGGQRLYDLARRGAAVTVPQRMVEIFAIAPVGWQDGDFPELTLTVRCGAGTYIRALARDWGERLGVGATLAGLVRLESGGFALGDSVELAAAVTAIAADTLPLVPAAIALGHLPTLTLDPDLARAWCLGQKPPPPETLPWGQPLALYDQGGEFLGVGYGVAPQDDQPGQLRAHCVFRPWVGVAG